MRSMAGGRSNKSKPRISTMLLASHGVLRRYECLGSDDTCISEWMRGRRPRKMGGEKGGHYVVGAR